MILYTETRKVVFSMVIMDYVEEHIHTMCAAGLC
jgi:hypothetical protein